MTKDLKRDGAAGVEEVLEDVVDLEEYAREGKRPPLSRGYRIRINGDPFVVSIPDPPVERSSHSRGCCPLKPTHCRVKLAGEKPRKVELDEKVICVSRGLKNSRHCRATRRRAHEPAAAIQFAAGGRMLSRRIRSAVGNGYRRVGLGSRSSVSHEGAI